MAGANGNTCGRKLRGDEKQLIDLEWPYSWGGITYGCHGIESLTVGGVEMLTVAMEWLTYTVPITAGVESPMANCLRLETLTVLHWSVRPLQVALLFLVLDLSKDHAGGRYKHHSHQYKLMNADLSSLKCSCIVSRMCYVNY